MVKKGEYWQMLAAVGLVAALACGYAGGEAVGDQEGGELSSQEGHIAFTRITNQTGMDIESDIYTINVDGTAERKLTDTPGLDGFPSWSPDGTRIAFSTDRDGGGNWEIYVMRSDGTHQRRLTNTPEKDEGLPAWSPDGEKIAYVADVGPDKETWDNEEIFVMNADGSGRTRLTDIPGNDHWPPTWSPDGTRLAFTSDGKDGYGEIYVMSSDGSGLTQLTHHPSGPLEPTPLADTFPSWRP